MQKSSPHKSIGSLSLARAGLASALAVLLFGATGPRLAAQSDNFNDGNDTAGVAWTHYSLTVFYPPLPYGGTTYSFPDDGKGGKAYGISAAATGADPYGVKNARGGELRKDEHLHHSVFGGNGLTGLVHRRAPHHGVGVVPA